MVCYDDTNTAHPIAGVSVVEWVGLWLDINEGSAPFEVVGEYPVHHFLCARYEVVGVILSNEPVGIIVDVIDVSQCEALGFDGRRMLLHSFCQAFQSVQ